MVKIVVVDQNALSRIGLVALLKQDARFELVGDFKSFHTVRPLIPTLDADLVIIDISLNREGEGEDVATHIKHLRQDIKVIILTFHKEEFHILNAVETGVDGYIHKDSEAEELLLGINRVLEGEKFFSREVSNLLIGNLAKKNYRGHPFLTSKEKEIIRYIMEGYSSKEIAALLEVSPRTIDTHRANILGKFNLKNTTELITRIAEQKIRL
jgi:DNA-binding NarL/FixJ family response regulator